MTKYPIHPLCAKSPDMSRENFAELVEDIKEHGLHEPIWLYEGQVIDGRHRQEACKQAGVEPTFEVWNGTDPAGFVASLNIHRRHLKDRDRRRFAAAIEVPRGRPKTKGGQSGHLLTQQIAAQLSVSPRTIRRERAKQRKSSEPATDKGIRKSEPRGGFLADKRAQEAKAAQEAEAAAHHYPRPDCPVATEPARKLVAGENYFPSDNEIVIGIVRDCYKRNFDRWNALPAAAPMVVVDAIVAALEKEM